MRKIRLISLCLFAALFAGACSRLDEKTALNIYVRLPEQAPDTRAVTNWSSLLAKETRINDLRIWVFLHTATDATLAPGMLLGYLEPKQLNISGGEVQKFSVSLDRTLAAKIQTVDVYVLANAGAAGLYGIGMEATPADLDALVLSGDLFGIDGNGEPTATDIIDNVGLPYTAFGKNLALSGSGSDLSIANVELVRAVSKVQFVFAQKKEGELLPVEFQITGLELSSGQIPEREYLFNDSGSACKIDGGYVDRTLSFINLPTKAGIAGLSDPGSYAYNPNAGESALSYQNRIYEALVSGTLTGYAPCYLRESDKALSGRISYRIGGSDIKTVSFSMGASEQLARNRSWVLYFYFNNNSMTLSVSYSPWEDVGPYTIIGR